MHLKIPTILEVYSKKKEKKENNSVEITFMVFDEDFVKDG